MKRTFASIRAMYDNAEIDGDTMDDMMNELDLMTRDGIEIEEDEQPTIDAIEELDAAAFYPTDEEIAEERKRNEATRAYLDSMTPDQYNEWLDQQSEEAGLRIDAQGARS